MTQEEMRQEFNALYSMMANSTNVNFMHIFGQVHKEMMEWMIQNKPDLAQEWIWKLESIKWKNYLTPKEADKIVAGNGTERLCSGERALLQPLRLVHNHEHDYVGFLGNTLKVCG